MLLYPFIYLSSIYIKKNVCLFVCLFVLYAFGHGTTKCNEILHTIPFRPEEGHRIVFDPKFLPEGGVSLTIVGFTTVNAFFREFVRMIAYSITRGRKSIHIKRNAYLFAMRSVPVIASVTKLSILLP